MNRRVHRDALYVDDQVTLTDRQAYGEALMSGVADEALIRKVEGERAMGSREFAATLKMERGRYRIRRGRPVRAV
jgi:hypothetical protein